MTVVGTFSSRYSRAPLIMGRLLLPWKTSLAAIERHFGSTWTLSIVVMGRLFELWPQIGIMTGDDHRIGLLDKCP